MDTKAKKSTNINPADFLLNHTDNIAANTTETPTPEEPKTQPDETSNREKDRIIIYRSREGKPRTKRTQVSFTPEDYEKATQRARQIGISFNEYVNRLISKDLYGLKE